MLGMSGCEPHDGEVDIFLIRFREQIVALVVSDAPAHTNESMLDHLIKCHKFPNKKELTVEKILKTTTKRTYVSLLPPGEVPECASDCYEMTWCHKCKDEKVEIPGHDGGTACEGCWINSK